MTREEQIRASAVRDISCFEHQKYYELGAQWADEHPREGLVDIEKVCDWLRNNFEHYAYNYGIGEVIVGLTKAMEE